VEIYNFEHKETKSLRRFLLIFIKSTWVWILLALALHTFSSFCSGVFASDLLGKIVDNVSLNNLEESMVCGILYISFWMLGDLASFFAKLFTSRIYPTIEINIRMSVFHFTQKLSLEYMGTKGSGFVANCIDNTAEGVKEIVEGLIEEIIPGVFFILYAVIYFTSVHFVLGLFTSLWIVVHSIVYFFLSKRTIDFCRKTSHVSNERTHIIIDQIRNFVLSRIYNLEKYSLGKVHSVHKHEKEYFEKSLFHSSIVFISVSFIAIVFQGLFLFYILSIESKTKSFSTGYLVKILQLNFWVVYTVWERSSKITSMLQSMGQVLQSLKILNEAKEDTIEGTIDCTNVYSKEYTKGKIEFRNLSFSYKNKQIFKNLSLTINSGEKIVIIGSSGAGKTTLFNILTKLVNVSRGSVFVDDIDICDIEPVSLRKSITYITQSNVLFDGDIYENIIIGNLDSSMGDVIKAAKKAEIHDLITALPDGYKTKIGTNVDNLSGGQKQRICIARAILAAKNGFFLCDECTNSLDHNTSKKVQQTIFNICDGKTLLWIDHHLSRAFVADKVLMLLNNNVIFGKHSELIETNEDYIKLFEDYEKY
jgi:ABC-type multidrug transport system fused ATPase/permease subunit